MAPKKNKYFHLEPAKKTEYQLNVKCDNCKQNNDMMLPFGHDFIHWREERTYHAFKSMTTLEYQAGYNDGKKFIPLHCPNCGSTKLRN